MAISNLKERPAISRLALIGAFVLLATELLVIGVVFKHGIDFTCLANWPPSACRGASGALISIYCVCAALVLFAVLFKDPFVSLFAMAGQSLWPLLLNLLGFCIALMPWYFLSQGSGTSALVPAFLLWIIGMATLLAGLLLYLAPFGRWMVFFSSEKWRLLPLIAGGMAAPMLATLIRPLWQIDTIAGATFSAVAYLIPLFGFDVEIYTQNRVIGFGDFYIDIAPVCSGIEGIALVTIFTTLYLFLFKSELRFPRVLILYPIGIAISATLNVVRIVVLLAIGLNGNPELAVGGFHSHAGWLMFVIVSLGGIAAANTIGWLRNPQTKQTAQPIDPFFQDQTVAMILPFAIFMFSALLSQTFTQHPGVIYPARVVLMAGALYLFLPVYRQLSWRLDPVAISAGVVIGLMWVLIPVADPSTAPPYATLTGAPLILWFVARGIGTIFLVPIIEELFFRGYLEQKLKLKSTLPWVIGAAVVIATIFAALHGRWAEAFVASLALSYVMHRSGRVSDAILAHGVANTIVFAVAAGTGKVHII